MKRAERRRQNLTLTALTSAGLAFALLQTMVVPALPAFERELHTTTAWATWLLTAFLLCASVATPILGRLGDQYGKKRLLLVTLGIFLAGCLGAIVAWDVASLIVFRVVQGVGFAVFPLSFGIVRDEFPPERIGFGLGVVSSVFGGGSGLGFVLSGVIVDHLSWRFIFVVGSGGLALAAVLVARLVPESATRAPARLDVPGAVLLSAGMFSLLLALTEGESWGWGSAPIVLLFAAAAALLAAWPLVELRVPYPMVDVRMLARRAVLFTNLTNLVVGVSAWGAFVMVPTFVQAPRGLDVELARLVHYGFGASATMTGIYLLPHSLAILVLGPAAGARSHRFGHSRTLSAGMALVGVSALMLALWHAHPWQLMAAMLVFGAGIAFAYAASPILIAENVAAAEMGVATGVNIVMRNLGGVVGGQVAAAVVTAHVIRGTGIPAEGGFVVAFWAAAVAGFLGCAVALLVTPLSARRR